MYIDYMVRLFRTHTTRCHNVKVTPHGHGKPINLTVIWLYELMSCSDLSMMFQNTTSFHACACAEPEHERFLSKSWSIHR